AYAVEVEVFRGAGVALGGLGEVGGDAGGVYVVVDVVSGEVGQDFAAVGGLPPEEAEGELVGVVPVHFLGDEVVHAGALVDLRELPVVAEGVGVPADARGDAVLLLEVALADEELANEGFAVGEVEVGLDPHAAYDLPAAFFDALANLVVHLGIFFGNPCRVLRGGLAEGVAGVLVHELQGGGEGALDDVYGFGARPEPGGVDVGVAGLVDDGLGEDRVKGGEDLLRFAEGGVEGGLVAGFEGLEVDCRYCFFYFGEEIFARGGECGQDVCCGDALDADVFGVGAGCGGVGVGFDLEVDAGKGFFVHRVEELDGYEDLVAGLGWFEKDDGFEVVAEGYAAAVEVDDLGHGAVAGGVELEPDAGTGDVVAVEGLGDFNDAAVPDGVLGGFGPGLNQWPTGVVEGGGFAVGDVAGVKAPFAGGQGVEHLEGVQLCDRGGGEVFLLPDGGEGLG
ncbi:MAG: hypothetical protein JWQ49_5362, partial [Edaphobacter sp.]|nr:hypothetical protein [Edaphobacter sp.]